MKRYKKARLIENDNGNKLSIVASVNDENDIYIDSRSKKPFGIEHGQDIVYMQELNQIEFIATNKEKKSVLTFLAPNNVGILLSIANKALQRAQTIYDKKIDPNKHKHTDILEAGTDSNLTETTIMVYEYIESIQTSIVFGYTAIEAFINLSIDDEYKYMNKNSKGITEVYDKKAIERWLSLQVKISEVLSEIYECKSIKQDKIWNKFLQFEERRNQIIHQKSIDVNSFYKEYFEHEIFELCGVPQKVMQFFFEKGKEKEVTNALWPVVDPNCDMAIFKGPNAKFIEYIGIINDY